MYTPLQLLEELNRYITGLKYPASPKGLYDPVEYVLSVGGKRIRPVLMLMAYNLYKENIGDIFPQAAGIETYHNYTLLHDDLMDKAFMRRNKPTVHIKWNENTAILSGDAMLVLAYQYMADTNAPCLKQMLDLFSRTALEICEGQQFDMEFESRMDVTEGEYMEMIRLKTAVLLGASLRLGAMLGGADEKDQAALYDFGIQMGLAFQLKDDFLDVYGDPTIFGKNIGGDILCNKKTYLLIRAFELSEEKQKAELIGLLNGKESDPIQKIASVTRLYDELGVKESCEVKMQEYYDSGLSALQKVSVMAEKKNVLKDFAEEMMYRIV